MQDIGPKYAGVLLGLSNTAGVLAGVISTAATGYILASGTWNDVWSSAIFFYIIGTVIWNLFATGMVIKALFRVVHVIMCSYVFAYESQNTWTLFWVAGSSL